MNRVIQIYLQYLYLLFIFGFVHEILHDKEVKFSKNPLLDIIKKWRSWDYLIDEMNYGIGT